MTGSTDFWRAFAKLRDTFGVSRAEAAICAAEMLAAGRLESAGEPLALAKRTRELTAYEWEILRERAEVEWQRGYSSASGGGYAASPFILRLDPPGYPPGFLEVLRSAVVGLLDKGLDTGSRADMLEIALDLARDATARSGEDPIPEQTAKLIAAILSPASGDRAYCAFASTGPVALLLAAQGVTVTLDVPTPVAASFWSALSVAVGVRLVVQEISPFDRLTQRRSDLDSDFDLSVVVPPFGAKIDYFFDHPIQVGLGPSSSEAWSVVLASAMTRRSAVCVVPNSFLFRSVLNEQSFRHRTIRDFGLSSVIALPPGSVLANSSLSGAILLLNQTNKSEEILMVDLGNSSNSRRRSWSFDVDGAANIVRDRRLLPNTNLVGLKEIEDNDVNLMPDRYVLSEDARRASDVLKRWPTAELSEVADLYRPQALSSRADAAIAPDRSEAVYELAVSDLDELGLPSHPAKVLQVSPANVLKLRKAELQSGDIVLVTKGSVGRVGFIAAVPAGETWVANQSFAIVRLRRNSAVINSLVLFRYLASDFGQDLIRRYKVGAVIAGLQMGDVRRLEVPILSVAAQRRIAEEVEALFALHAQIGALRQQLTDRQHSIWPDRDFRQ